MNELAYFKEHICEELDDAVHYLEKAIALKHDKARWAKVFAEMSNSELKHATSLFEMFQEEHDCDEVMEDALGTISSKSETITKESVCKCVTDKFASAMTKIKVLKDVYYGRI